MAGFDAATQLAADGDGRYTAELDPAWSVGDKLHGGYLLSLAGRAALAELGAAFPDPLVASAHYLAAPDPGPAQLVVTVLRQGRNSAHTRVTLSVAETPCFEALVTCGTLDTGEPFFTGQPVPELPAEDDCPRLPVQGPSFAVELMDVLEQRLDPACLGWVSGRPSGRGSLRGWLRFADGREPDPLALLTIVDALPPAAFDLGVSGWVPTIALTCHVRATPAKGPLVVRNRTWHVAGGRLDEECHVWDATGVLVATSHQLAGVRLS